MKKVKNIRQAFSIMKKRFPDGYVAARMELRAYPGLKDGTDRRVYTESPKEEGKDYGIAGSGETWDEAFAELDAKLGTFDE